MSKITTADPRRHSVAYIDLRLTLSDVTSNDIDRMIGSMTELADIHNADCEIVMNGEFGQPERIDLTALKLLHRIHFGLSDFAVDPRKVIAIVPGSSGRNPVYHVHGPVPATIVVADSPRAAIDQLVEIHDNDYLNLDGLELYEFEDGNMVWDPSGRTL